MCPPTCSSSQQRAGTSEALLEASCQRSALFQRTVLPIAFCFRLCRLEIVISLTRLRAQGVSSFCAVLVLEGPVPRYSRSIVSVDVYRSTLPPQSPTRTRRELNKSLRTLRALLGRLMGRYQFLTHRRASGDAHILVRYTGRIPAGGVPTPRHHVHPGVASDGSHLLVGCAGVQSQGDKRPTCVLTEDNPPVDVPLSQLLLLLTNVRTFLITVYTREIMR